MHSEVYKFKSNSLYEFTEYDDDEFNLAEEVERLEAHLNDPCEDAWWVYARCKFLSWEIHMEIDPITGDEGLCIFINGERVVNI